MDDFSIRCRVCNTSKIYNGNKTNSKAKWECPTCGNLIDVKGNVVNAI